MDKILTIVVPVYNTEKYLRRCLDSILLSEVLNDIEVILVNDGSKDSSLSIIREYEDKYSNTIVVIDKKNGGHGSTINYGLKIAKGKYFRVIDSDDWVNCIDFIEYVERLKYENSDLVVTNYSQEHVYDGNSISFKYVELLNSKKYEFDKFNLLTLKGEYFVMATSTYKTSILRKSNLKLLEKTFYVDMIYNIIPIKEVKNFTYYNLDIYRYFIGRKDQSMNLKSFVRNEDDHEKVMKYLLEYYNSIKENLSEVKKNYIELILYYMLFTHYTIFCIYDSNCLRAYKKIVNFDKYLKHVNIKLYERTNVSYIKLNRKFHFVFVLLYGKLARKIITIKKLLLEVKNEKNISY